MVAASLGTILKGRVCLVGVGNRQRGDDGAGSWFIERVQGRLPWPCVDAGVAPENRLEEVVRAGPDTILLVDALNFGAPPGACCLLESRGLQAGDLSTHAPSLALAAVYWQARLPVRIFVLGIQPASTGWRAALSPAVERALELLVKALSDGAGGNRDGTEAAVGR